MGEWKDVPSSPTGSNRPTFTEAIPSRLSPPSAQGKYANHQPPTGVNNPKPTLYSMKSASDNAIHERLRGGGEIMPAPEPDPKGAKRTSYTSLGDGPGVGREGSETDSVGLGGGLGGSPDWTAPVPGNTLNRALNKMKVRIVLPGSEASGALKHSATFDV